MRFQLYISNDEFGGATADDIIFPGVDRAVLTDSFIHEFRRAVFRHIPNLMDITPDDDITVEVALDTDIFHIIVDNCTYNEHPDNINRMVDAVGRAIRRQVNDWITDFYSTARRVQVIWPTR